MYLWHVHRLAGTPPALQEVSRLSLYKLFAMVLKACLIRWAESTNLQARAGWIPWRLPHC